MYHVSKVTMYYETTERLMYSPEYILVDYSNHHKLLRKRVLVQFTTNSELKF